MNILFISQYFYPEQFLNNHVARRLVDAGHSVDVYCCVPNYPSGDFFAGYSNSEFVDEEWHGVNIHRVTTIPRGQSKWQLAANYLAYPLAACWALIRKRPRKSDISFVSMPSPLFQGIVGIFAKKAWGIPTVYWVQDIWPDSAIITLGIKSRLATNLLNSVCGWIYRRADLILVQSDGFHSKIQVHGVDPDKIKTLPNGAPDNFRPMEAGSVPARIRDLVPQDRRTIMFAGNIGESQDFETIISAAALLPPTNDVLIVVVGSGRREEHVRKMVKNAGLESRFLFLGRHAEEDMPAFFACADVMLVSLRDEAIFKLTIPSKIQCYMACGKPVLASLSGAGASLIAEVGAGLVVDPGSPVALSAAMDEVSSLSQPELHSMGKRARTEFEAKYSLEAIVGKLTDSMHGILTSTSRIGG